jgi:hypothetical protein
MLSVSEDGILQLHDGRIDEGGICIIINIDEDFLCVTPVVDIKSLCTSIGEGLGIRYRADTTRLTADNTSITCDYAL